MLYLLYISPAYFFIAIFAIVVALSIHEFSHALGAYLMGDKTSQYLGRLTLNPIAHIDWIGFLLLVVAGFGWGKPVPFNVYNLRNNRWGQLLVALFGPVSNFLTVVICFLTLWILLRPFGFSLDNVLIQFLFRLLQISFVLGVFNLIPIPPLDGSKVLFSFFPQHNNLIQILESRGPFILIFLIIVDNFTGINIFGGILDWAWRLAFGIIS